MSDKLTSFRKRADEINASLATVKRYVSIIELSRTNDPEKNGTAFLALMSLPPEVDNILGYEKHLARSNGEKSPKLRGREFPLENVVHEISMFMKSSWTLLVRLALSMQHWIRMKIPKIEERNSLGIEVQGAILTEIDHFRDIVLTHEKYNDEYADLRMSVMNKFYKRDKHSRADITGVLATMDLDHFNQFETQIREIELELEYVFDRCTKNVEKLMAPTNGSAMQSMY